MRCRRRTPSPARRPRERELRGRPRRNRNWSSRSRSPRHAWGYRSRSPRNRGWRGGRGRGWSSRSRSPRHPGWRGGHGWRRSPSPGRWQHTSLIGRSGVMLNTGSKYGFVRQDCGEPDVFAHGANFGEFFGNEIPPDGTRVGYDAKFDERTGKFRIDRIWPETRPSPGGARHRDRSDREGARGDVTEVIDIPSDLVPQIGRIIGKGGVNVKHIEETSGAVVTVTRDDASEPAIHVIGARQDVEQAREMIHELMQGIGPGLEEDTDGDGAEEMIELSQSMVWKIMGKRGATVLRLQDETGAKINISKTEKPPKVRITGRSECVARAVERITALMDEVLEEEAKLESGQTVEETMEVPPSMLGRIIGKGGETVRKLEQDSGARIDVNKNDKPPTVCVQGSPESVAEGVKLISELLDEAGKGNSDPAEDVEETMEIPHSMIRSLIGKGGENINKLEEDTGAKVDVDKHGQPVTARIQGSPDAVARAVSEISAMLEAHTNGKTEVNETVELPRSFRGKIIGTRGARKNEIEDESGAQILVDKDRSVCRVHIAGTQEQVDRARALVQNIADGDEALEEGAGLNEEGAEDGEDDAEEMIEVSQSMVRRIIGKRGATVLRLQDDSGARIDVSKNEKPPTIRVTGRSGSVAHAVDLITALMDEVLEEEAKLESGQTEKESMEIPPSMLGRIIGKGGETVRKLEQDSGARIDVNKHDKPPTVCVQGSPESVAAGVKLISELLDEAGKGNDDPAGDVEETMEIPQSMIRRFIGKGGENIMRLEEDTGAKVDVDKNSKNGQPATVFIQGSPDAVGHVVDRISAFLEENRGSDGQVDETMELPRAIRGKIIGTRGEQINELRAESGAQIELDRDDRCCRVLISGTREQVERARTLIQEIADRLVDEDVDVHEEVMEVSPSIIGRLLGHRGEMIMQMEENSGAKIDVDRRGRGSRRAASTLRLSGSIDSVKRARDAINLLLEGDDSRDHKRRRYEADANHPRPRHSATRDWYNTNDYEEEY